MKKDEMMMILKYFYHGFSFSFAVKSSNLQAFNEYDLRLLIPKKLALTHYRILYFYWKEISTIHSYSLLFKYKIHSTIDHIQMHTYLNFTSYHSFRAYDWKIVQDSSGGNAVEIWFRYYLFVGRETLHFICHPFLSQRSWWNMCTNYKQKMEQEYTSNIPCPTLFTREEWN